MRFAYAVLRDDLPQVFVAEDLDILHRVIALHIVAQSHPDSLPPGVVDGLREALLEERWGDAVSAWISYSGLALDIYDDLHIWTAEMVDRDLTALELQFTPLFASG